MRALTPKQEAFAVAYIKTGNASEAYRDAYGAGNMLPKTINEKASRLLNAGKVGARINELRLPALRASAVTVERTIEEAARISYSDMGELLDDNDKLLPIKQLPPRVRAAIASIKLDKDTGRITEVKLWDKNAGLDKTMRHLGLFREDNAQKGENIKINVLLVGPP